MGRSPSQDVMEELRATLWARVGPATLQAVDELAALVPDLERDPDDASLHRRGIALAHTVAGSAGLYGFSDAARAAAGIESLLRAWPGADGVIAARRLVDQLATGFEDPR